MTQEEILKALAQEMSNQDITPQQQINILSDLVEMTGLNRKVGTLDEEYILVRKANKSIGEASAELRILSGMTVVESLNTVKSWFEEAATSLDFDPNMIHKYGRIKPESPLTPEQNVAFLKRLIYISLRESLKIAEKLPGFKI